MTLLSGAAWSPSDDSGDGQSGTIGDAAWVTAIKDSIDALIHDAGNPTVDPADIISEVVLARGSKASLDARLDVTLNADGTQIQSATSASVAQLGAILAGRNLVPNGEPLIWPAGDAAAPAYWVLAGAGAAVARTTTGANLKVGGMAAQVTRASAATTLSIELLDTTNFAALDELFKSRYITIGCWIQTSTANAARIYVNDGIAVQYTSYHTGDGTYQWLSASLLISSTATKLEVGLAVDVNSAVVYMNGFGAALSAQYAVMTHWIPSEYDQVSRTFAIVGNVAVVVDLFRLAYPRAALIKTVLLSCVTAPATTDIRLDLETWDGSGWNSMFSGTADRPAITAGGTFGVGNTAAGTYRYRCLAESSNATGGTGNQPTSINAWARVAVDVIGTGTVGADVSIIINALMARNPLEAFLTAVFP